MTRWWQDRQRPGWDERQAQRMALRRLSVAFARTGLVKALTRCLVALSRALSVGEKPTRVTLCDVRRAQEEADKARRDVSAMFVDMGLIAFGALIASVLLWALGKAG